MFDAEEADHPSFGLFFLLICFITGVDPVILARCPRKDQMTVLMVFWLQVAIWIWQSVLFSVAAHMMMGRPGEVSPALVGMAVLAASIIALTDAMMFIHPSWARHGIEGLKRVGLMLPGKDSKLKYAALVTFRLGWASLNSMLAMVFACLLMFAPEINQELIAIQIRKNAPVTEFVTSNINKDIGNIEVQRETARQSIGMAESNISNLLHPITADPTPDKEANALAERAATLTKEKGAADNWYRHLSADDRRSFGDRRINSLAADLKQTLKHLHEAQEAYRADGAKHQEVLATKLAEAKESRRQNLAHLAELDKEYRQRIASREADIRKAVEADPSYVGRGVGLLSQAHALIELTSDRWIATIVGLFELTFLAVELAAVFVKMSVLVPDTYSTEQAKETLFNTFEASHTLTEQVNALGRKANHEQAPVRKTAPDADEREDEIEPAGEESTETDAPSVAEAASPDFDEAARQAQARAAKAAVGSAPPLAGAADGSAKRPRGRPPGSRTKPPEPKDQGLWGDSNRPDEAA